MTPIQAPRAIGVGVWGLGCHARRKILPALHQGSATRLVGVGTRNHAVAREEGERYSCTAWLDLQDMLGHDDVEAVYVATPIGLHYEHGKQVLEAGKHLWCEKSLTDSNEHSAELVALSRQYQRSLCEGLMYLYHPQFKLVRRLISDPAFGAVISITCRFGMPHQDRSGFRYSPTSGGGALLDVGCYPLSAALSLVADDPEIRSCLRRRAPTFDVDTDGYAVLEFPSGTYSFLEWGFGRAYRNEIEVWGELGSLYSDRIFSKLDGYQPNISVTDARGGITLRPVPAASSFAAMFREFAKAVHDEDARELHRRQVLRQSRHLTALSCHSVAHGPTTDAWI